MSLLKKIQDIEAEQRVRAEEVERSDRVFREDCRLRRNALFEKFSGLIKEIDKQTIQGYRIGISDFKSSIAPKEPHLLMRINGKDFCYFTTIEQITDCRCSSCVEGFGCGASADYSYFIAVIPFSAKRYPHLGHDNHIYEYEINDEQKFAARILELIKKF